MGPSIKCGNNFFNEFLIQKQDGVANNTLFYTFLISDLQQLIMKLWLEGYGYHKSSWTSWESFWSAAMVVHQRHLWDLGHGQLGRIIKVRTHYKFCFAALLLAIKSSIQNKNLD